MSDEALRQVVAIAISGVVLGSLYALMALGLSLVWGTLRLFNFAHGALLMMGAYVTWQITQAAGEQGLLVGTVVGLPLMFLIGVVTYRLVFRPFLGHRNAEMIVIVTGLAAGAFIQNGVQLVWGPQLKQLPVTVGGSVTILGTGVGLHDIVILVVDLAILGAFAYLLGRTRLGLTIRAVQQNPELAQLVGIDRESVYAITFGLSATLAGAAGLLLGSLVFITPTMGDQPLLKAFVIVVFGGLGSLFGTTLGAFVVGTVEAATISTLGFYWAPVVLFLMMIAVLVVRPRGLLGSQ